MSLLLRDFEGLQDECLQYGYGERERTFFQQWLNEASYDVATRHRWRWLDGQTAIATVAGTTSVAAASATIMIPERLRPTDTGLREPVYVPWDSYANQFPRRPQGDARGVPTHFSFYNDKLEFYPTPDAVYNYMLYYYGIPAPLTLGTQAPWMPIEHRGVLVSGALMKMAARDKDFNAVQYWSDQYEGQIAKMRVANNLVHGGSPNKVPMPKHYGWGS